MAQLLRTLDEYIASFRSAQMKRQIQDNPPWTFWSAISLEALNLDQLVVWCAGSRARYMFDRRHTLEHFRSLPDPTATVCKECYENQLWANTLGGNETGIRKASKSVVKPWEEEPNFGIKFRWRRHSHDSPSSPYATNGNTNVVVCPHLASLPPSSFGSSHPSPNTSFQSTCGDVQAINKSVRFESAHGDLHDTNTPAISDGCHRNLPPIVQKRPRKSCLRKNSNHPHVIGFGPDEVVDHANLPSVVDWEENGGIYPILSAPMLYINHPTFGPKRLNPPVSTEDVPGIPHTKNGRPVITWSLGRTKSTPHVEFPNRHPRIRFDSRTSLPATNIPELEEQPTAQIPKIVRPPEGSVQPYVMAPSMVHDWEYSKYIITTTEPNDQGLQFLRKGDVAGRATLRADTLNLSSTRDGVNQMAALLASSLVEDNVKENIRAIMIKMTMQRIPRLKTSQSNPESLTPQTTSPIDLSLYPAMIRKSTGEMAPRASALADAIRQAQNIQTSLAAFENLQTEKHGPTPESRDEPIAPSMVRSNTRHQALRTPSRRKPRSHSKKSSSDWEFTEEMRLTEKERAKQAAGAVLINPPAPERKKIGAPSPIDDKNEDIPLLVKTDSMDTVIEEETESMSTTEAPYAKSPHSFRPSASSALSRSLRESRMHTNFSKASNKDVTSLSGPLPTINEAATTLVNSIDEAEESFQSVHECPLKATELEHQGTANTTASAANTRTKSSDKRKAVASTKVESRNSEHVKGQAQHLEELKSINIPSTAIGTGTFRLVEDEWNEWDPNMLLEECGSVVYE